MILLAITYLQPDTGYSILVNTWYKYGTLYVLLNTCYLKLITWYLLPTTFLYLVCESIFLIIVTKYLLIGIQYLVIIFLYMLSDMHYLILVTCYLLPVTYFLTLDIWCATLCTWCILGYNSFKCFGWLVPGLKMPHSKMWCGVYAVQAVASSLIFRSYFFMSFPSLVVFLL